jgi:hypothetical protein
MFLLEFIDSARELDSRGSRLATNPRPINTSNEERQNRQRNKNLFTTLFASRSVGECELLVP